MFDLDVSVNREPATIQGLTGEQYAWMKLTTLLREHPELAALCRILHGVDSQYSGVMATSLVDRDLKDALRIVALAKRTLNELDPDIMADAVENVAIRIAEGIDVIYGPWANCSESVKNNTRRLAQSALNERDATLERAQ